MCVCVLLNLDNNNNSSKIIVSKLFNLQFKSTEDVILFIIIWVEHYYISFNGLSIEIPNLTNFRFLTMT